MISNIQAIFLGILEGLTEFLPISSTGHLILANYFLDNDLTSTVVKVFEISVQLGAILAVVFYYFRDLIKIETIKLLIIGVLPTIFLGLIFKDFIDKFLEMPTLVAGMLILGGVIILFAEKFYKKINEENYINEVDSKRSFIFGVIQSLAMIPGVSRSGAIIISGLLMGYKREVVAKYAFLLAVPTMSAATGYSILKNYKVILESGDSFLSILLGFVFAFLTALIVVKYLIPFVKKFSFAPFGYYRIVLGICILFFI